MVWNAKAKQGAEVGVCGDPHGVLLKAVSEVPEEGDVGEKRQAGRWGVVPT